MKASFDIKKLPAALAIAGLTFCHGPQTARAQLSPQSELNASPQQVSRLSLDNAHPAVALSADGKRLFVAWDGIVEGNRRIFLREQVAGEWLPAVIVDSNPTGENSTPSIAVDHAGVPHISWISSKGGNRQPVYARRISRSPNVWHEQTVPFPSDSTVTGNCDQVSLRLDDRGQPWLVWQYGFGNVYSIACSHFDEEGTLVTDELTPGATTHNIYPELFFLPQPTVYWYLAQSDQFYLIGSQLNKATGRWSVSVPDNLENLPAQSFPDLYITGEGGPLGAIWYDRLVGSDGESNDQVFIGRQDPESRGRGEAVEQNPDGNNHSVSAANVSDKIVAAWVSETYHNGSELFIGAGNSPATLKPVPVGQSLEGIISNPRLAATSERAAIVWEESIGLGLISSEIKVSVVELDQ